MLGPTFDALKHIHRDLKADVAPALWQDKYAWAMAYWVARTSGVSGGTAPTYDKKLLRDRPKAPKGCTTCPCSGCDDLPEPQSFPFGDAGSPPDGKGTSACSNSQYITCLNSAKNTHEAHSSDCRYDFALDYGEATAVAMVGILLPGWGWVAGGAYFTVKVAFSGAQLKLCADRVDRDYLAEQSTCIDLYCK